MGMRFVLLLWGPVSDECVDHSRGSGGSFGGGERCLSDPRAEQSIRGPLASAARRLRLAPSNPGQGVRDPGRLLTGGEYRELANSGRAEGRDADWSEPNAHVSLTRLARHAGRAPSREKASIKDPNACGSGRVSKLWTAEVVAQGSFLEAKISMKGLNQRCSSSIVGRTLTMPSASRRRKTQFLHTGQ